MRSEPDRLRALQRWLLIVLAFADGRPVSLRAARVTDQRVAVGQRRGAMKEHDTTMKALLSKRVPVWVLLVVTLSVLAGGVLASFAALRASVFTTSTEVINTQVVSSVSLDEQVVLMGLGVQGVEQKREDTKVFGLDVPGSERAAFVQYSFTAKLGIEGADVKITQTGDKQFRISIPGFVFIGLDDPKLALLVEDNGILSAVTPEIDQLEIANHVLGDDAKATHIAENTELLEAQATLFYTKIVHSIDPEVALEFEFLRP